jgi:hypothetical protein
MGDQTKPCSQILKEGRKQNKQKKNGNNGGWSSSIQDSQTLKEGRKKEFKKITSSETELQAVLVVLLLL